MAMQDKQDFVYHMQERRPTWLNWSLLTCFQAKKEDVNYCCRLISPFYVLSILCTLGKDSFNSSEPPAAPFTPYKL